MEDNFGRLQRVALREGWASEAGDFTPWLAKPENLKLLSEALDLDLTLEAQEQRVGPYRADILCRDIAGDSWVLIENQLEKTDHSHLGQLLTYAAGLSAVSIVWIAERFTDEHRAALDWLNEKTPDEINFFGLEVELWRIGNSKIAPKFNIVSKPNLWTRRVIDERENTEKHQLILDFWGPVFERLRKEGILTPSARPFRKQDATFDVGWKTFRLKAYFSLVKKEMGVWVSTRGPKGYLNYETLKENRDQIEKAFGKPLDWQDHEDKNRGTLFFEINGYDAKKREDWPNQHELISNSVLSLYRAVSPFIPPIDVVEEGDEIPMKG